MNNSDVVIILPSSNDPQERLAQGLAARRFDTEDAAAEALATAEIVMSFGALLSESFHMRASRLRWLQVPGSGTDRIFDRPGFRPETLVTNAPGIAAVPVAEAALAYMFALARRLDGLLANQRAARWARATPQLLYGRRLLVVGTGGAALALAVRAKALGMAVRAVSATPRELPPFDKVLAREALRDEAAQSDFLVVLTGLSKASRGLVDREVIDALPAGAALIDLSRGGITDTAALCERLSRGELRAALDVFEKEPLPADSPLWHQPGLIVSPHIAGLHDRLPELLLPLLRANLAAWRTGDIAAMTGVVHLPTGAPSR